jgi:hypothetical protein
MKKYLWISLALIAVIGLFACNKQKPVKLDYKEAGTEKLFDQKGLPGENYVGTPPEDAKHRGYDPMEGKGEKKEAKKEEVEKEEKKPPEKKPEEKKPEEKKPEEKK